jgi:uncharacterized protein
MTQGAVGPGDRIVLVDALRGVALLAMLYTHMVFWYAGALLPDPVYLLHQDAASRFVVAVNGWLVLGKALLLFAFLFGLSFWFQMGRTDPGSTSSTLRYVWRLAILGAIGLVHQAIWRGDILTTYAALALCLLPARRLGDRALLAVGLVLATNLPFRLLEALVLAVGDAGEPLRLAAVGEAGRYHAVLLGGSLADLLRDNWRALYSRFEFQLASGRLTATLGFLLLGMLAGRQRWFGEGEASARRLARVWRASAFALSGAIAAFVALGAVVGALGLVASPWSNWGHDVVVASVFDPALVLFYASGTVLLLRRARFALLVAPLAAVGRVALTAYLSQSGIALLLFPACGLGLFGRTSPAENVLLAASIFALQIALASLWLRHFRFGPVEWLWRSLTYFEPQPIWVTATRSRTVASSCTAPPA